jgi:hypothetical protein
MGFGERFLNDIRRVDASGQPAIESQRDHPPQAIVMPSQKLLPRDRITASDSL